METKRFPAKPDRGARQPMPQRGREKHPAPRRTEMEYDNTNRGALFRNDDKDPNDDNVRFPLVRDGLTRREKCVPPDALPWLAEVERLFPGATKDMIIVRKPNSSLTAREGMGNNTGARGSLK